MNVRLQSDRRLWRVALVAGVCASSLLACREKSAPARAGPARSLSSDTAPSAEPKPPALQAKPEPDSKQEPEPSSRPEPEQHDRPRCTRDPDTRVLARLGTPNGALAVIEECGVRVLTLNGREILSRPVDAARTPSELARVVRALAPRAKTVLSVGARADGATRELVAGGLRVHSVDVDPAIAELARRYFEFAGTAEATDARAFFATTSRKFDLVLVPLDRPLAGQLEELFGPDARARMCELLAPTGRVLFEVFDSPVSKRMAELVAEIPQASVLGAELGTGEQPLYVLGCGALELTGDVLAQPVWPTVVPGSAPSRVVILGYLNGFEGSNGSNGAGKIHVDLPQRAEGPARYFVEGASLRSLIPERTDDRAVLAGAVGGGDAAMSLVHFSERVVVLEGNARVLAAHQPDDPSTWVAPLQVGGALYELSAATVLFSVTRDEWESARRRAMSPCMPRVTNALEAARFLSAASAITRCLQELERTLGPIVRRFRYHHDLEALARDLKWEAQHARPSRPIESPALSLAAACQRLTHGRSGRWSHDDERTRAVRALVRCAESFYTRAMRSTSRDAPRAAARLLALWTHELSVAAAVPASASPSPSPTSARALELTRQIADLESRFPGIEPEPVPGRPARYGSRPLGVPDAANPSSRASP